MVVLTAALATAVASAGVMALGLPTALAASAPGQVVLVNPNPVDNTPHVLDGRTQAVADLGDRVLIGGKFTAVKLAGSSTTYQRTNLFAYNKTTGAVDPTFNPAPDGLVTTLLAAPDGEVFVAGQFRTLDGTPVRGVAKIDPVTGAVDPAFDASTNGMVYDMHLVGGLLFLGGTFTTIGDVGRTNFGVVDPATGAVLGADVAFDEAPTGLASVQRFDVSADGTHAVVIGNFTRVGGQFRQNIAQLDLDGAAVTVSSWQTDVYRTGQCNVAEYLDSWTKDVAISPDGSYFVVTSIGGWHGTDTFCDTIVRWNMNDDDPATPTWRNDTGGDSTTAVAITDAAVYVAGHFRYLNNSLRGDGPIKGPGSVVRTGIAALDTANGVPLTWNPGRERGLRVWRLVPTADGMYVLSDSSAFAGEWHPRLTYLTTAGGIVPTHALVATSPTTLRYAVGKKMFTRSFDGSSVGGKTTAKDAAPWNKVRGVVPTSTGTYRFLDGGVIQRSTAPGQWERVRTWEPNLDGLKALTYVPQASAAGRLLYTITGDPNLYARGFGVDDGVLSTIGSVLSGPGVDGLSWSDVTSMTVIDGALLYTRDGELLRTPFNGPDLVSSATITVSGPGVDGVRWALGTHALTTIP